MENKATQELEKWFDTESSASVLKEQLNALMKETEAMIESESSRRGTSLVEGSLGGMRLDEALLPYLNRVQSFIHPAIEKGRTSLNEAEISVPSCQMDVSESWFKVKKGFWDWILFRSSNGLRRKLLGSSEALEKAVTPAVKKRRMGDDAREFIQEKVIAHLDSILPVAPAAVAERMLSHYVETVQSELREGIEAGIQEQKERQSDLEKRIEQNQEIRRRIEQLVAQGGVLLEGIPLLQEKYNAVNWEDRQGDNNSDSEEREGDSTESKDASVSNEASSGFSEDDLEGF